MVKMSTLLQVTTFLSVLALIGKGSNKARATPVFHNFRCEQLVVIVAMREHHQGGWVGSVNGMPFCVQALTPPTVDLKQAPTR